jgi:hypothetical protein
LPVAANENYNFKQEKKRHHYCNFKWAKCYLLDQGLGIDAVTITCKLTQEIVVSMACLLPAD